MAKSGDAAPDIAPSIKEAEAQAGSNTACYIPYDDLREWLTEAERLGEVQTVNGANVEEEIGMAAEMVLRSDETPCVVFDEIPGYEKGFRVLTNFFGGKRKNMTLGFPTDLTKIELSDGFYEAQLKEPSPIEPEYVEDGPVFENIMDGDDVNVLKFPAPMWHEDDGGRYLGTGTYSVTVDPDTGWVNVGTYRIMVHDEKHVGYYISPGKHGRIHRDKYMARGEPMPTCVVVGGDPMTFLTACTEAPMNESEFNIVSGFRNRPTKLVRGKHTGVPFPANAEIVLEGYVHPGKERSEGPFGEWTGYYASDVRDEPVLEIKAIYYRNNPIILGCPPHRPPDEICRYRAITRSGMLRVALEKSGVPDVTATWAHEAGNARLLLAVAIKQRYPGHAAQAGHIAAMCHVGAYLGRYVIVVDEDIDVSNLDELIWAMLTRSDPAESIDIIKNAWSGPLDPMIPAWEKEKGNFAISRAVIDACRPYHWKDDFPKVNAPSPEMAKQAREKFGYLLD